MYKSLLSAIGLFALLLLLCAGNPSTAIAESSNGMEEGAIIEETAQITGTNPVTETILYSKELIVQNQLILEVLPSYSSSVTAALEENAFSTEILYERSNENVVILATKELDDIQQPIEQQIEMIVSQNVDVVVSDSEMVRKNVDSGDYASALIADQKVFLIGNPHGIGAVPFGLPINAGEKGAGLMPSQWALAQSSANRLGIALYDELGEQRSSTATGNKIRIVLFDTSPFTFPVQEGRTRYTDTFVTNFQIPPFDPLTLKVTNISPTQPYTYHSPTNHVEAHEEITETETLSNISSHGLFAAALAYAVAPNAEIELVQVLDSYGRASTAQLATALNQLRTTRTNTQPIILNLSLGVLRDSSPEDEEMRWLQQEISDTLASGVIIVASAGNMLTETASLTMQLPAGYAEVIGVGASNATGRISCFSKYRKVAGYAIAAPGGDANFGTEPRDCLPKKAIERCVNHMLITFLWAMYYRLQEMAIPVNEHYNCSDMLIGLTYDPQTGGYRYGYWMGTSFAAPIVSGLIALELENGRSHDEIYELFTPTTRGIEKRSCLAFINAQFATRQISCQ